MKIVVQHFAEFAEIVGQSEETIETNTASLLALYVELRQRHGFRFQPEHVRAVRNNAFATWTDGCADGDIVSFLPPFSGG